MSWSSLVKEESMACQINSPFNKNIGRLFCKVTFLILLKNNPAFCWMGKLSLMSSKPGYWATLYKTFWICSKWSCNKRICKKISCNKWSCNLQHLKWPRSVTWYPSVSRHKWWRSASKFTLIKTFSQKFVSSAKEKRKLWRRSDELVRKIVINVILGTYVCM